VIFLLGIYGLDLGSIRTRLTATAGSIFDIGVLSLVGAFGALGIGTNETLTVADD
jgi:hypothetical protein